LRIKLLTVMLVGIALFSIAFTANGQISLDSILVDINSSGRSDFGMFRTQSSLSYSIPETRVEYYYTSLRMAPADIYMAAELSYVARVPVERVVQVYRIHKNRGWGYIAREIGIRPGSREFMRLKDKAYNFHGKMKHGNRGKHRGGDRE
jgi:hypothetical protein